MIAITNHNEKKTCSKVKLTREEPLDKAVVNGRRWGKRDMAQTRLCFRVLGNELYTDWYSNALFQLCLVSLNGEWADARQESHTEQDLKPDRMPCVRAVADVLARLKVQYESTFPIYWAAVSTAPVLQGMPHVHCNSRQTRHCNVF